MRYQDFDIWIDEAARGRYPLRAAHGGQGEARDAAPLEDCERLAELADRLVHGGADPAFLSDFGARLHACLFQGQQGDISTLFERSRGASSGRAGDGLRLRLRIEPPAMAHLPWELMYSAREREFLATNAATALVRYVELRQPIASLETPLPARMLVVVPSGSGLDVAAERRLIEGAVQDLERKGRLALTWLEGVVTLDRVADTLGEARFHLLHFVGHGGMRDDQPFLQLNDAAGGAEPVGHARFASLFRNHPSMKLVVLNSCQGAEVSSTRPLVGMAPELVRCGIPAVVAMRFSIPDRQAVVFAREFYRSRFRGPERGRVEPAISNARNRLAAEFPGDRVVGAPVLFTRAREGVLFDVRGGTLRDVPLSPTALARAEAVLGAYEANAAAAGTAEEKSDAEAGARAVRQRIRVRNLALAAALAVAVLTFAVSWLNLFARLPAELKVETYAIWLGDLFRDTQLDERLALVAADQPIDRSWRDRHAVVLDRLSAAGARVVVFDVLFPGESTQDAAFAAAMRRAAARGTRVVLAVDRPQGGPRDLSPTLRQAAAGVGVECLGRKLQSASIVPLVIHGPGGREAPLPGLALAAYLAYEGAHPRLVAEEGGPLQAFVPEAGRVLRLEGSGVERVSRKQPGCPAIEPGDTVHNLIVDQSGTGGVRARTFRYADVEGGAPGLDPSAFRGRIVVVGEATDERIVYVARGVTLGERYGFQVQADAVSTLLAGTTIAPAGDAWQFGLVLTLALGGALLGYRDPAAPRRRLVLGGAIALYLGCLVLLYAQRQVLLAAFFHLGALLVTYSVVLKLKRRLWPR